MMMNNQYKDFFPALSCKVHQNKPLIYLDNGATSLTLKSVINAESNYYNSNSSNVHRGVHELSQIATTQFEETRKAVASFINSKTSDEIIFTKGTTDSLNLLSFTIGQALLKSGDEILISTLEHHSNIVPWHLIAKQYGFIVKEIPIDHQGNIIISKLKNLVTQKTKLISFTMASNTLGVITPYQEILAIAKEHNLITILDAAQAAPHMKIDVTKLDCDFLVFSAHKMLGPTGVGVLYGKEELLKKLPPYQSGGGMIADVEITSSTYLEAPQKFEAGTPNIAGVIAFKQAIDFLHEEDICKLEQQELELLEYAHQKLLSIDGLRILGPQETTNKVSVISFLIEGIHPTDIGMLLDEQGIAIRTGHHCTQPLMKFLGVNATCRASISFYNTKEDIDLLHNGLLKVKTFF